MIRSSILRTIAELEIARLQHPSAAAGDCLPIQKRPDAAPSGKSEPQVDDRRHSILIVDDERTIAETLTQIVSASGYETRAAYSAEQALEIISEWLPDLAIMDVVLPLMNGIDLAILLTAQCPTCRLMLFSGQWITTDLLADAAKKGYTFDILAKPVNPTVMLEIALNLLVANQPNQSAKTAASEELRLTETNLPPEA